MKKIAITVLVLIGLAAGFAYAHGNGYGMRGGHFGKMHGGSSMMGGGLTGCPGTNTYGQNGWDGESQQQFLNDTKQLRKQMNDKRFEYMEAKRNTNTTNQQLAEIEKEMVDLRTQLQDKASAINN